MSSFGLNNLQQASFGSLEIGIGCISDAKDGILFPSGFLHLVQDTELDLSLFNKENKELEKQAYDCLDDNGKRGRGSGFMVISKG